MPRAPLRILLPNFILLVALSGFLTACSSKEQPPALGLSMAPLQGMPAEVHSAPVTVQEAYQFAVANPAVMTQIPCYCGCGSMGHTSNYSCYTSGEDQNGAIVYDTHALGCSICVDITQDTMRLLQQGKSVAEIRSYVDQTYSQYGPSNIPEPGS